MPNRSPFDKPASPHRFDDPWLTRWFIRMGHWLQQVWGGKFLLELLAVGLLVVDALHGGLRSFVTHLTIHLLRFQGVRSTLRLVAGTLSLIIAVLMGFLWLTHQPILPAEMVPIRGTVVRYDQNQDGQLQVFLTGYQQPFVIAANAKMGFDTARFTRTVQPGDEVVFQIRQRQQQRLNRERSLVVFAVNAHTQDYLTVDQVAVASNREVAGMPIMAGIGLVVGALLLWNFGLFVIITVLMVVLLAFIHVLWLLS